MDSTLMIDPGSKTIKQIAVECPAAIPVLEKHHFDFCWTGDKTLDVVAAEMGVPLEIVLSELRLAVAERETEQPNWNVTGLDALMRHIVVRHHAYLRNELPLMERLIARLREARGRTDAATVAPLEKVFRFFKRELENHLRKEEEVLFPMIARLEAASVAGMRLPRYSFGPIANPIGVMEEEHDAERRELDKMLGLTGNYSGPADACNMYRICFDRLKTLEADMRRHVHLENHILFPRVEVLENASC
jgi:regulator of cell morphogenesis and NO signaling